MPFDIERQRKDSKRSCYMCRLSPENILMLACDDSICLQCAYVALKELTLKQNPYEEIEFRCKCCNEVTYFDKDLIKQIETSIRPQKRAKKDESFIQKMKKQYLCDENTKQAKPESPSLPRDPMNPTPHTTPKQASSNSYKQFHTNQNNNYNIKQRLSSKLESSFRVSNQQQPQTVEEQEERQELSMSSIYSQQQQQSTRCRSHTFYQLLYYCLQCQSIVCSQCLLRGKHKNHNNSSITQILSHSLPQFINQTSQLLLSEITRIQSMKQAKQSQMNKKLTEIKVIRQNALNYFTQVKQNIEKQQDEVLRRCDGLVNSLLHEQREIQNQQKEAQQKLAGHIREIKSLKSAYRKFREQQQQQQQIKQKTLPNAVTTTTKKNQRLLIEKFSNCEQAINNTFLNNVRREQNKNAHFPKQQIISNISNSNELENQSMMLKRHIEQSIKSIRDSLVLPTTNPCTRQFMTSNNNLPVNNQPQGQTQRQRKQQQQPLVRTSHLSKPPKASYISYLSTDNNSPNNNTMNTANYNFIKKQQRSLSISPYKVPETSYYSTNNTNTNHNYQTKINRSKRHSFAKQDIQENQKENISWQTRQSINQREQKQSQALAKTTKLTSQTSSQNVSSKKKPTIQQQQKSNSIHSKSKNNSITKKKHPKIASNNLIGKFQI